MSEATEVLAAMQASSGYPVAMLPQPYVTTAQMQMEGLKVALESPFFGENVQSMLKLGCFYVG